MPRSVILLDNSADVDRWPKFIHGNIRSFFEYLLFESYESMNLTLTNVGCFDMKLDVRSLHACGSFLMVHFEVSKCILYQQPLK